jgi:Ca2+-binding EF-hand superfamily protein
MWSSEKKEPGMSIQATGSGGWNIDASQQRRQPPDMSKDQLVEMQQKLKSAGQDTSNLDKIIANFDQLDTDKSGKISLNELKTGAQQIGIQLPKGHHHHGHHKVKSTQDQDAQSNSNDATALTNNATPPNSVDIQI